MDLPKFIYHPDPIATGSIKQSQKRCKACGRSRGFVYTGPAYCKADLDESVCPWCIANGEAHRKFQAVFTDCDGIGGYGDWEKVPKEIIEQVAFRTPGFSGWQSERWFTHCGDAAEFLGPMGRKELEELGPEAVSVIKEECGYDGEDWERYFRNLDRNYHATAYLFRCRQCGKLGGYSDCD